MSGYAGHAASLSADHFADLLRVAMTLCPDEPSMLAIMTLLAGRDRDGASDAVSDDAVTVDGDEVNEDAGGETGRSQVEESQANQSTEGTADEEPNDVDDELDIAITERQRTMPAVPEWVRAARPLMSTGLTSAGIAADPSATLPPLLPSKRARAILTGFLAMPGEGEVDVDALTERVAKGHPLFTIPRRLRPTLGRGVHLLVDRSDAMMPFLGDIAMLSKDLACVAGLGQRVESFAASPLRGCGIGSRRRWSPFGEANPPLPGSRVICITDLGLGGAAVGQQAADPEEWIAFAATVRRLGCSPGAIVPYEPERWPKSVRRAMDLLFWDPATRASDALRDLLKRRIR
jgi:hypothetical protein